MQKLVIGMPANQGFTLIELLVVLVIVGITLGFALVSFGDFGQSRQSLMAIDQFVNTVSLAQQQAILESSTLGIRIQDNAYQILKYQPPHWVRISNKGLFSAHQFPAHTQLQLTPMRTAKKGQPQIIINSSGDLTPFQINIGSNNHHMKTLTGRHDGNLQVK